LHARTALFVIDKLTGAIEQKVQHLVKERDAIRKSLDAWVIAKFGDSEGYEDDQWKATKVVGHDRSWNLDKLEELVPADILEEVLNPPTVNAKKIDELVRAGRIDRDEIEDAFEEKPKAPYVKLTRKTEADDKGDKEAAEIAAKLA
jgi:hypothetical protein